VAHAHACTHVARPSTSTRATTPRTRRQLKTAHTPLGADEYATH
jgi:hypothetical protein